MKCGRAYLDNTHGGSEFKSYSEERQNRIIWLLGTYSALFEV